MRKLRASYFLSRLFLVVASTLLTMMLLEIGLRLFHPQLLIWDYTVIWEPVAGVGWQKKPNLDVVIQTAEGEVRLLTDANGYRVGDDPSVESSVNILAVGDSFLEAPQVAYEASMTALMSEQLSSELGFPVTIVNTGVSGWDPNHYRIQVAQELEREAHDLVLVFLFLQNDLITESITDFAPTTILSPPPIHPNQTVRQNVHAVGSRVVAKLRQTSHLYRFFEESENLTLARLGKNPAYLPKELLISEANDPKWQVTTDVLLDLAQVADAHDTAVLFITLPPFYYLDDAQLATMAQTLNLESGSLNWQQPSQILSAKLAAAQLDMIDVTPTLRAAYADGNSDLYGRIDKHFSPEGHRVVADFLSPIVYEKLATEIEK